MWISRFLMSFTLGAGAALVASHWLALRGVWPDESAWLRWLIVLSVHPIRAGLAAVLGLFAWKEAKALILRGPGLGKNSIFVTIRVAARAVFNHAEPKGSFTGPNYRLHAPQQSLSPRLPTTAGKYEPFMSTTTRESIVSKPAQSPGLGLTVKINPCQDSFREGVFLSQAVVVTTIAMALKEYSKDGAKIRTFVVDGDYCPLRHDDFRAISENLKAIAKKWFPKARLHLIGFPRYVNSPGVSVALQFYHQVTLRLEAGTQKTFAAMTGEKGAVLKDVLHILERLDLGNLVIRARFIRGDVENSSVSEVRNWVKMLTDIRPAKVEIRSPLKGFLPKTKGITATRLKEIQAEVEDKLEAPCEIID
ncbi:MAG: hypothetical protein ACJAZ8_000145 [Planctomycetota bacterium]|jgi:hypothetical protein